MKRLNASTVNHNTISQNDAAIYLPHLPLFSITQHSFVPRNFAGNCLQPVLTTITLASNFSYEVTTTTYKPFHLNILYRIMKKIVLSLATFMLLGITAAKAEPINSAGI
jgi:hypothetical protein